MDIRIGADATGDLKTSGGQETTTDDAKSSTSNSSPGQTIDLVAIAAAAGEPLKTAVPGSKVATLATAALEAAEAGDGKTAAAKLEVTNAAATTQQPTTGGP